MVVSTPSEVLGPENTARDGGPDGALVEEMRFQRELALQRVSQREQQRLATQEKLGHPEGLVGANDPLRVTQRLDRVTRYLSGGRPMESPAAAAAAALVGSAAQRLGASGASGVESAEVQEALLERVINTSDFVDVRYLEAGVLAQRCVGRVIIRDDRGSGLGYGTGFLVSPCLLLTNHHVLPDPATARSSRIEFDYQDGIDGKPLPPAVFSLDPDRFFAADRELDFALVTVAAEPAVLARYGFCPLTAAQGTVIIGEFVTIVQHPRGAKKQLVLRENKLIDIPELVLHYAADTEPGSSGSPVFNDQWEVVALHHASIATPQHAPQYQYLNEGIRISRILHRLRQLPLTAAQAALLAQLTTARPSPTAHADTISDAPAGAGNTPAAPPPETALAAPTASTPSTDGAVEVEIPLRITVQLGAPVPAPTLTLPRGTATSGPPATDGQAAEAISIDPDYSNREGYREDFLGTPLPLPGRQAVGDTASAELKYHHFSVVMHRHRRLALFTAVNIDGRTATRPRRDSDRWIIDPRLPRDEQTGEDVYRDNPLDRGHLVRRLDPAWGPVAKAANDDTFHFTNATPQHHDFNAGQTLWLGLEDYILHNTDNHDLTVSVITGPVLHDDDPRYRGVALPRQFFKLVAMVTTSNLLTVTAYLLSQEALLDEFATAPEEFSFGAYRTYQVPVRRIAELTALDLHPYIAADPLERLEATPLPRMILRPDDIILGT